MTFNDTSTKNGLLQNCESLCNLGDTGITGNTVYLNKFTGWLNDSYGKVCMAILTVDKNWRWDDFNYGDVSNTDIPVATATLVTGQRDYILPRATNSSNQSTLWKVYKVRLKNTDGTWYDVIPLGTDEDEIADSGRPTHYRLLANSIRLSGPPLTNYLTLTAGIQVWFQREFDRFTTSDTTQQPGFISAYHYLLPLEASATFLLPNEPKQSANYLALFNDGLEKLKQSYAQRNDDPKTTKRMSSAIVDNR